MKAVFILGLAVCALASAGPGYVYRADSFASGEKPVLKGYPFRDFSLETFFEADTKAVVLVFAGSHCPLVKQYLPTLRKLNEKFKPQGVRFLMIYSDRGEDLSKISLHAVEHDVPFRPLWDVGGRLGKALGAEVLTEAVVFDKSKRVVYQGAIDDQFFVGGRKEAPTQLYLDGALTELLADIPLSIATTDASGCRIEYPFPKAASTATYCKDILPILQEKCQVCHRPGEIGAAFQSFTTYDEVYQYADTIREAVIERRMPPYYLHVNPKFGALSQDHTLSAEQIRLIDGWVTAGAPEGDKKDTPPPKVWPVVDWHIGKPDLVIPMPETYKVQATGIIDYQFFRLPLNFPEDRWVSAIEMKPGNTEVVHHMQLHLVPHSKEKFTGTEAMTKLYGLDGEKGRLLHGFVPGDTEENIRIFPESQAIRIPKNMDLILEMHYTTVGKETTDRSLVAMSFRPGNQRPETELCTHAFRVKRSLVKVPAHAEHHGASKMAFFRKDVLLHQVRAHMHQVGKSLRLDWVNRTPAGIVTELFAAFPIYDFNWQRSIHFQKPVFIPAGQEIELTGYWDNSKFNPYNPEPERPRKWGIQTRDEMLSTGIKFSIVQKDGEKAECFDAIP